MLLEEFLTLSVSFLIPVFENYTYSIRLLFVPDLRDNSPQHAGVSKKFDDLRCKGFFLPM